MSADENLAEMIGAAIAAGLREAWGVPPAQTVEQEAEGTTTMFKAAMIDIRSLRSDIQVMAKERDELLKKVEGLEDEVNQLRSDAWMADL